MAILRFVVEIGTTYLLIGYGLKFVQLPFLVCLPTLGANKRATFWVNCVFLAFGTWLLVSLTSETTLLTIPGLSGWLRKACVAGFGMVTLFLNQANIAESRNERIQQLDAGRIDRNNARSSYIVDRWLIWGGLLFLALCLCLPVLSFPRLTDRIILWLSWVSELFVLGWIVKVVGLVNLVGIAMGGLTFCRRLLRKKVRGSGSGLGTIFDGSR